MWNLIVENYLSVLVFMPVVFALLMAVAPDKGEEKNLHGWGIGFSVVLFLASALAWAGVLEPVAVTVPWIESLGIHYALGSDGLTYTMVFLTTLLLLLSAVASLTSVHTRLRFYYAMLFVLITAVLGVFLARDFFLFFLFWELELIPMYFLIAIWGGPRRGYAAIKFVLYTLFGSVFLVAAILGIYFLAGGNAAGSPFLFSTLEQSVLPGLAVGTQILLFLGLFITFAVKLPMVPFHTWLPDAHVEAPTPISMLLAGILLKMGAYGMLRFCFGFFPAAAHELAPYIALLAFINIVYTAGVAMVQEDMKKLIAYSSVSHMGFVLLGLATLNAVGFNGAVFVMFSHGLVSAALFMCVGTLYTRTHSRLIADYGGFGSKTPVIFYFFMFMALASLGLPLLISFASETLVFYGAFLPDAGFFNGINLFGTELPWTIRGIAVASAIGVVLGAAYLLWLLKRVFYGPFNEKWAKAGFGDANTSEVFVLATLALLILAYGLFPKLITNRFDASVTQLANTYPLRQYAERYAEAEPKNTVTPLLTSVKTGADPK